LWGSCASQVLFAALFTDPSRFQQQPRDRYRKVDQIVRREPPSPSRYRHQRRLQPGFGFAESPVGPRERSQRFQGHERRRRRRVEEAPKANPESQISHQLNSASEIVENLPKVWKVLIELLSHQSAPVSTEDPKNPCYKVVETPKGPHLVLSVSQTFIRLKVSRASPATLCSCETFSGPHLGEEVVGAGDLSLEATQQPPRGPHAGAGEAPGASLHRAVRDLARGRQTPEETPTPPHPGEDPALRTGPEAQTPHRTQGRTGVQSREVAGGAREELQHGETVGTVAHRVRLEEERRR
jgi:hypothetical protein